MGNCVAYPWGWAMREPEAWVKQEVQSAHVFLLYLCNHFQSTTTLLPRGTADEHTGQLYQDIKTKKNIMLHNLKSSGCALAVLSLCSAPLFLSCDNKGAGIKEILAERDSIVNANKAKDAELKELSKFVTTISDGLDSLAQQENILLSNKSKDGTMMSREQIRQNLKFFEEMLSRQRSKIQQLQDSVSAKGANNHNIAKLNSIIDFLKMQLEDKENEIKKLKGVLNDQNRSINELRSTLSAMRTRSEKAEKKAETFKTALATQDEIINECYVKIGTKRQLKEAGLLKTGFLKKKKIEYSNIDKSKFVKVDIRKLRSIPLQSNNPKILTPMPSTSSFHFDDNLDGRITLVIDNPTKFWSVSNYLIIQL